MFKNIKLIIFDLDGTMINSAKDIMISNNLTLKKFGFKPISYQNVKNIIGQGIMANIVKSLHMQKISPTEDLKKKMYKYFFFYYKKHVYVKSKPYPGLITFLQNLKKKNYKLAVCSNKLEALTRIVLKKSKLIKYFDYIAGGDTFVYKKPHPSVLNNIVKKFKISKKEVLFIGDSEHDYESAKNSKVKFCLKLNGFTNKPVSFFKDAYRIKKYTKKII